MAFHALELLVALAETAPRLVNPAREDLDEPYDAFDRPLDAATSRYVACIEISLEPGTLAGRRAVAAQLEALGYTVEPTHEHGRRRLDARRDFDLDVYERQPHAHSEGLTHEALCACLERAVGPVLRRWVPTDWYAPALAKDRLVAPSPAHLSSCEDTH